MERLTKWVDGEIQENHDFDATAKEWKNGNRFRNGSREIMKKLAAYEDSGLTPERVNELSREDIPAAIDRLVECESLIPLDKAREWVDAEQDGRLVVLPCKIGDTLWFRNGNGIGKGIVEVILMGDFDRVHLMINIATVTGCNIRRGIAMADEVADKSLTAENAIYNYEWFKSQKESIDALKKKEQRAIENAANFKADLPLSRESWAREDKNEYDRLNSIATGLNNQLNDAIADYNARVQMATRNIFKDDLPTNIADGIEAGLKFTFWED